MPPSGLCAKPPGPATSPGCSPAHPCRRATIYLMRHALLVSLLLTAALAGLAAPPAIQVTEGTVTIPSYVHSARETQPPLFSDSSVGGLYPFTTYVMPYQPGGPKPKAFRAVFIENEYLKLTYIPDFGGRIFSLYDKLRGREVFYRNDVLKPAHYNPRISWTQSGIEMTGPYDAHMLTLYGEPFWSHKIVRHPDGSVSLVLGEIDPVYHMKVNLTATLHPSVAALQMSVFCYNRRDGRMPQMIWLSAALSATREDPLHLPHGPAPSGTPLPKSPTGPSMDGTDYSWDRNNKQHARRLRHRYLRRFPGRLPFRPRLRSLPLRRPPRRAGHEDVDLRLRRRLQEPGARLHRQCRPLRRSAERPPRLGRQLRMGCAAQGGELERVVGPRGRHRRPHYYPARCGPEPRNRERCP